MALNLNQTNEYLNLMFKKLLVKQHSEHNMPMNLAHEFLFSIGKKITNKSYLITLNLDVYHKLQHYAKNINLPPLLRERKTKKKKGSPVLQR